MNGALVSLTKHTYTHCELLVRMINNKNGSNKHMSLVPHVNIYKYINT